MARTIHHRYRDPLELIWLGVARRIGWRIERSGEVYASWDGQRTLTLGAPADLDADDNLGQMVLHEICHALVQGEAGRRRLDWGLCNFDDRDLVAEHACHRVQAALADTVGLRGFFAVTTDWRPYWDALPADPLAPGDDPAIALARAVWPEATTGPWSAAIRDGLAATAALATALDGFTRTADLWSRREPQHPLGGAFGPADARCGGCAWRFEGGPGRPVPRCRRHASPPAVAPRIEPAWPACAAWERPLTADDCLDCGACCRHGFDLVQVGPREPLVAARPELVAGEGGDRFIPRPDGRCAALEPEARGPWPCAVYPMRPRSCREFAVGGEACLEARRRVGASR